MKHTAISATCIGNSPEARLRKTAALFVVCGYGASITGAVTSYELKYRYRILMKFISVFRDKIIGKDLSSMVEVKVNPGVCGLQTSIKVDSDDMQTAVIEICTDCPNIKPMEQEPKTVDGYEVCFAKLGDSAVYELAKKYCRHAACPVPSAIIKGVEVACGLALPRDVEIKITKE